MFGVTTPCVDAARAELEARGYEVLVFHATLTTGRGVMRPLAIYNPAGPERDLEALPDFRETLAGSAQGWDRR